MTSGGGRAANVAAMVMENYFDVFVLCDGGGRGRTHGRMWREFVGVMMTEKDLKFRTIVGQRSF